jgi:hypothetical protein
MKTVNILPQFAQFVKFKTRFQAGHLMFVQRFNIGLRFAMNGNAIPRMEVARVRMHILLENRIPIFFKWGDPLFLRALGLIADTTSQDLSGSYLTGIPDSI